MTELIEQMEIIAFNQTDQLLKSNTDMLASCKLFENGGQYSQPEIDWYSNQMKEIDELLVQSKEEKGQELEKIKEQLGKMLTEPFE